MAMLAGTLVTIAGFVPDRLRRELGRRVHLLALCRRQHRAGRLLVRRGGVRAGARRRDAEGAEDRVSRCAAGPDGRAPLPAASLRARSGRAGSRSPITLGLFAASVLALPLVPRQFFPASDRPELLVDLTLPQNASIYASENSRPVRRRS